MIRFMGAFGMRGLMVAVMMAGAVVVFAAPARAACSICQNQSKIASTTAPGKFDYRGELHQRGQRRRDRFRRHREQ
jgi:hypothetical protein